jgi:uncharacterized protein (DUF433 family)
MARQPEARLLPSIGRKTPIADLSRQVRGGYNEGVMTVERVIVADPEVMNGMPCFRGTRVPFKNLMDYIEGGHPLSDFLDQFPSVTREMAVQALEEAKESLLARIA